MSKIVDIIFQVKDNATGALGRMSSSLVESRKQWTRAGQEIERTGKKIESVGSGLTKSLTVPIVGAGTIAASKFAEVDKTMALVNATMQNSVEQADMLNAAMSEAAANSTFGMSDAAEAALNFARGGWDATQAANALAPAMNLAAGEGGDLTVVSAGLMATMNAFKAPADQAAKYADVFANACNNSALDVNSLSTAMSVAAPIFKTGGLTVSDAALAMGVMANNGTDANVAANALKSGLARLADPAKEGAVWLDRLGVTAFDANGNMKDMVTVQGELNAAFATLSAQEQEAAASAIFGKNQMSAWLGLINTAPADVKALSASLDESNTSAKMATAMMEGFGGSIEKLKSSFDVFMTSMGKPIATVLTPMIDKLQGVIDKLNSLDEAQKEQIVKIGLVVASIGPALMGFGKLTGTIGTAAKMVGSFGGFLAKIPGAVNIMVSSFSGVSSITGLLGGVGKGLVALLGPSGTVVAVLVAIAAAAVIVYKNWDKIKEYGEKAFNALQPIIEMFQNTFTLMKDTVVNGATELYNQVTTSIEPLGGTFSTLMGHFEELAATPAFQKFISILEDIFTNRLSFILGQMEMAFTGAWNTVIGLVESAIGSFTSLVNDIMGIFDGLIQFITGVFTGNWEMAWEGVKTIFSNAFNALVDLAKTPINAVIALINGALSAINNINVSIPSWVPGPMGGKSFGPNIPLIPELYVGTDNWVGGLASINERGGEIVDLPRGTRVYPHDESVRKAYADGAKSGRNITIAKIADQVIIREQADIDRLAAALVHKLEMYQADYVGG